MSEEIVLVVNGKRQAVQAAEDTPLLYVLRNELGLTGPQYGCKHFKCFFFYHIDSLNIHTISANQVITKRRASRIWASMAWS